MDRHILGYFIVFLGGLVLSLEFYGLKFIQMFYDVTANPIEYMTQSPMVYAFIITILIILWGAYIIFVARNDD